MTSMVCMRRCGDERNFAIGVDNHNRLRYQTQQYVIKAVSPRPTS